MHLRRALMLFALVLGLAALAAAGSRPRHANQRLPAVPEPQASSPRAAPPSHASFSAQSRPRRQRVEAGRPATVTVSVAKPGQVEVPGLGLTAAAEPLTPARLDVLTPKGGRFDVLYTPAAGAASRRVGVLVVSSSRSSRGP